MTGTWSYALGQQQSSGVLYIWRHGAAMMDLSCNNAAKEKVGAPGQWAAHLIVTHNVHLQSLLLFIHGLTIDRSLIDERRTIEEATDRVGNNWQVQKKKKLVRWFMISPSESKKRSKRRRSWGEQIIRKNPECHHLRPFLLGTEEKGSATLSIRKKAQTNNVVLETRVNSFDKKTCTNTADGLPPTPPTPGLPVFVCFTRLDAAPVWWLDPAA